MNGRKIAIALIFLMGLSLIILGSVYNPYTEVVNLPEGGLKGIGFKMYGGEVVTYRLESFHPFTIYIMNKSQFYWLMNNGTFNGSYYTATGNSMNIEFTAPITGVYYIVIANFNSKDSIEVDLFYKKSLNYPLLTLGTLIFLISIIFLIFEIQSSKRTPKLDRICPGCGGRVSSEWKYCPYCRYEFGGKNNEN